MTIPGKGLARLLILLLVLPGAASSNTTPAQPALNAPRILMLYSYGYGGRGVELFSDGFFKAISEAGFPVTNIHAEYLDLQRNSDLPDYRQTLLDLLRRKYAQRPIDLIVTVQQPALDFLLKEAQDLAPQAPVITIQNRPLPETEKTGRHIVGEINQFDIKGTLERALELFPQTRRVLFASGSSASDVRIAEEAMQLASAWHGRLELESTVGLTLDEILQRVARLPPHTIVVFTQYNADVKGRVALAYEAERMIVKAANAPVFGFYDYNLKNGGIGGSVIAVEASGVRTGKLAIDILQGKLPASTGLLQRNQNIPMFDWQQIQHWGGDTRRLPADAIVLNRPPSAWQQYGTVILATLLLLAIQTALIIVLVGNIRRRKHAESVLAESEQRFRATFEQAAVGIALVGPDGRWLLVNRKLCAIVGYSQEELLACSFVDITHPDDLAADLACVQQMLAGKIEIYAREKRYLHKNGHPVWINLTVALIHKPDGTPDYFVSVIEDIAARKATEAALDAAQRDALEERERSRLAALNQMEDAIAARESAESTSAALRESQERLQLFIDHAPAALAMFDREMRYLAISRRWIDDYALGEGEIVGSSHYAIFPGMPERWQEAHRRGMAGEVLRAEVDRFERRDGSVLWLRWEVRPWHLSDGSVGGIVIFSEDITPQQQAEEEIRRLNADLERRVAERTAELTTANRQLDSFAYAVSHDLRAPLRAMNGFAQALIEDYGERLDGEAKHYLEQIGIASRKMGELIDGILALSRSTRGELQRNAIDLSALATAILADLARTDPARQVATDVAPGLAVDGDVRMIDAALRNLLGNAWKYTSKTAAPTIRVYAGELDGRPGICVADNGAGFDMAHAEHLFEPFRRMHRQDEFPGIGIGLATVQRIVHRHGGAIRVHAAPGQGAIFCFTLGSESGKS